MEIEPANFFLQQIPAVHALPVPGWDADEV